VLRLAEIAGDALGRSRDDVFLWILDPAVELRWDPAMVVLGWETVYRGPAEAADSLRLWNRDWNEPRYTVREILDGGDTLLLRMTLSGRGITSGVPTEMEISSVLRLDPLVIKASNFIDDAAALKDADFVLAAQGHKEQAQ
jgi:hypothetical protein